MQDIHSQMSAVTRTQEQLQIARSQFNAAIKEIKHTQAEIDALDKEQQEAEYSAHHARE